MQQKLTYHDYSRTPEGSVYQLRNGNLVCEPDAPYITHQRISGKIEFFIRKFVMESNCGEVFDTPTDVHFDDYNTIQPDILYISKERLHIIKEKYIEGAPDLVIEIISHTTLLIDTVEKKSLYEKFGVREYWLVFPDKKTCGEPSRTIIEVYILEHTKYRLAGTYERSGIIVSSVLNGLNLDLKDIIK
ncbi:MAG: Uma2 family endonuclease [Bacteroidia bacterium]|nr:Uma2 family endonuclease [Bacteroidia bacterium]